MVVGPLAHLVECLICNEEVAGSIPARSTKFVSKSSDSLRAEFRLIASPSRLWTGIEHLADSAFTHAQSTARPPSRFAVSTFLFFCGGWDLEWTEETRGWASILRIYRTGIFHNQIYHINIYMLKKYLAKYQKITAKLRSARLEARLTQVEAGKRLKKPQAYLL